VRPDIALCLAVACVALLVAGCGAPTSSSTRPEDRSDSRPSIGSGGASGAKAAAKATATEVQFAGWKAIKLTNGLVTVVAVPDIGGRIMDYRLGDHALLWNNPAEAGKLYDAPRSETERTWHNFGGYKVWPAPQDRWGGPPDPLGSQLDGGRWTGKIVTASGLAAVVELTSPADATVTGLQASRTIKLGVGTTDVLVTETFKNVSDHPVEWSIWTIAQVPGSLREGEAVSPEAKAYIPLAEKSRHASRYYEFPFNKSAYWKPVAGGNVLEVTYGGDAAKVGVDTTAGWLAYLDDLNGFAFATTFDVTPDAQYPDNGSNAEVWTNPSDLPYMEMEVLSPLHTLAPGKTFSAPQTWHCTRVGAPLVKVTDVAAIRTFPAAATRQGQLTLTGELGVFAPGDLVLEYRDAAGKALGLSTAVSASPTSTVKLSLALKPPAGAVSGLLRLQDSHGRKLGDVAQVPLANP
jgi:hypothetical protein